MKLFFLDITKVVLAALILWSPIFHFNVIENHFGVFPWKNKYITIEPNKRFLKTELICNNPHAYPSLLFGSSRANFINTTKLKGGNYYNMTYSAGICRDHLEDIRYLLKNGVTLKNIYIAIDYMSLVETPHKIDPMNFGRIKYPETFMEKVNFYKKFIFSKPEDKLVMSAEKMEKLSLDTMMKTGNIYRYYKYFNIDEQIKLLNTPKYMEPANNLNTPQSLLANLSIIKEIVNLANKNGINLRFFINPVHFRTYLTTDLTVYYKALQKLASITPYYDFSGLHSISTENLNYFETSHFNQNIGDLMIRRLNGENEGIPDDFGIYVTSSTVNSHLQTHLTWLNRYLKNLDYSEKRPSIITDSTSKIHHDTSLLQIKILNQHKIFTDTIHLSAPLITITAEIDHSVNPEDLYLSFRQKNYSVAPWIEKKLLSHVKKQNKIILTLPSHVVDSGKIALCLSYFKNDIIYRSNPVSIHVCGKNNAQIKEYKLNNNDIFKYEIDHIATYNRTPGIKNIHEKFVTIEGWAFNQTKRKILSGLVAEVNGFRFKSQFMINREDIGRKYNNPVLNYSGWKIIIPGYALCEGENKVTYGILNHQNQVVSRLPDSTNLMFIAYENVNYLEGLSKDAGEPTYFYDSILNKSTNSQIDIPEDMSRIIILGWAFDSIHHSPASGVILMIDSSQYKCEYNISRPDVSNVYKELKNNKVGFRLQLDKDFLKKGRQAVRLAVLSADKKTYKITGSEKFIYVH